MRTGFWPISAILACLGMCWATTALAQIQDDRRFDANRLRPTASRDAIANVVAGSVPTHMGWDAAVWLNYADDPVVLNNGDQRVVSLLEHRMDVHLVGALALWEWMQVGVDIPVSLFQQRSVGAREQWQMQEVATTGLGDISLSPKLAVLSESEHVVDLAVLGRVTFPTAAASNQYFGEASFAGGPEIAVSKSLDALAEGLAVAANLGAWFRQPLQFDNLGLTVGHEFIARLGVEYGLASLTGVPARAALSIEGFTQLVEPFSQRNNGGLEALMSVGYEVSPGIEVFASGGAPLRSAYTVADYRVVAGARIFGRDTDRDDDGIDDRDDACPEATEDRDGYEDLDGCPDRDNDGDGIVDIDDGAPDEPEDDDGFEQGDGVPDPDNDGDGVEDIRDACPMEAEDADQFQDADGCPDPDNDADGVSDTDDACPREAEDVDQFEDDDGCPDADNDGDGIADEDDAAPLEPEDADGFEDADGRPDPDNDGDDVVDRVDNCPMEAGSPENQGCKKEQLVVIKGCKLDISSKVFFDTGKASIQAQSYPVLNNLVSVMQAKEQIKTLRVEGHTDDRGGTAFNKQLSQRRAESVVAYLADKGIDRERLEPVGFGEDQPIESNQTAQGRSANRRVEFIIEDCEESVEGVQAQ